MRIVVNGRPRDVASGLTIAGLVAELDLRVRNVVVECNGEPLERAHFADVTIQPDDVLEVVRAVPGG